MLRKPLKISPTWPKKAIYDGLKFHRVIPNFVIQGGCPNTREGAKGQPGTGGPGYKIDCETSGDHQYHERGALSMAHAGKNTGGSQFFIVHSRDNTAHLDRVHTVFGKVVEGLDVIDKIQANDEIEKIVVTRRRKRPHQNVMPSSSKHLIARIEHWIICASRMPTHMTFSDCYPSISSLPSGSQSPAPAGRTSPRRTCESAALSETGICARPACSPKEQAGLQMPHRS